MARWALLPAFALTVWPVLAQPFQGQVGTPDQSLMDEDWYLLTPSEMPSIPLEDVTVSVLDCEESCPAPVRTDAAGWFTFPGLAMESVLLRFEPPACSEDDPECEPLEPREEVFENGGRTVLGAKWPAGIEDTILRYMPLVANTIYIKWKGEIPVLRSCGAAGSWTILLADHCRSDEYLEYGSFVHELTHTYEFRLRHACWYQTMDIDGWILQDSWLKAVEADREENGLGWVGEYPTEGLDEGRRARETLANFANAYFKPQQLVRNRRAKYPSVPIENYKTYQDMEKYAPNRYAFFERLVFARYLDRKSWERAHPDAIEDWPGMCEPFPPSMAWALDRLPPLPGFSKSSGTGYPGDPPPPKCSFPDAR